MITSCCPICERKVLSHSKKLYCTCCYKYVHRNCCGLLGQDFEGASQDISRFCRMCTETFLPFNHMESESTFLKVISEISQCQTVFENVLHESKLFNPFDISEEEMTSQNTMAIWIQINATITNFPIIWWKSAMKQVIYFHLSRLEIVR